MYAWIVYTPKEIINFMTQILPNAKIIIRNNQDKLQRFKIKDI